jgi:hypothetical protein
MPRIERIDIQNECRSGSGFIVGVVGNLFAGNRKMWLRRNPSDATRQCIRATKGYMVFVQVETLKRRKRR